jgi:hypothetical protein
MDDPDRKRAVKALVSKRHSLGAAAMEFCASGSDEVGVEPFGLLDHRWGDIYAGMASVLGMDQDVQNRATVSKSNLKNAALRLNRKRANEGRIGFPVCPVEPFRHCEANLSFRVSELAGLLGDFQGIKD